MTDTANRTARADTEIRPYRIEVPRPTWTWPTGCAAPAGPTSSPTASSPTSCSGRLYYETSHPGYWPQPSPVPTGVAVFAEDIAIWRYAEQGHNIVHWSEFDHGGHFAATDSPDLLIGDVRTFFRRFR